MNVLLATDANVERAGLCVFLLQWVRGIYSLDTGVEVTVYFRKTVLDQSMAEEFKSYGAEVITGELSQTGTSLQKANRNKVRSDIEEILSRKKYDILHVNSSAFGFSAIVLSAGLRAGIPIRISHSHGRNLGNGVRWLYLWLLKACVLKTATTYAGCSVDAGLYMFGKRGVSSSKWHFIPNTVSVDKFNFDEHQREIHRAELGIGENVLLLGASGLLNERKNHAFLLDVLAQLKNSDCPVKLIILGEGDLHDALQQKADALGISGDVILYGLTDDVAGWLSAMDVYLMPSLTEGLPIAAVEAQANGLPCLLSDGIPRDVDLSGDVFHLPIDQGADCWTAKLKSIPPKSFEERRKGRNVIAEAGFDESCTQRYVKELYQLSDK